MFWGGIGGRVRYIHILQAIGLKKGKSALELGKKNSNAFQVPAFIFSPMCLCTSQTHTDCDCYFLKRSTDVQVKSSRRVRDSVRYLKAWQYIRAVI